jgi:hypothetical protein
MRIACWSELAELLPPDVKVCVVADHGFGDQKLYRVLTEEAYFASSASSAISPSLLRPARPAPPPPGCDRADARACCAAPRSPPIAILELHQQGLSVSATA